LKYVVYLDKTNVVDSNLDPAEMFSMMHYVKKFVICGRWVVFSRYSRFLHQ